MRDTDSHIRGFITRKRDLVKLLLLTGVAVAAAACDRDSTAPVTVSTVIVSGGEDTLRSLGARAQMHAVARDGAGRGVQGRTVRWSSSNSDVVAVDTVSGAATAIAEGTAFVRARVDGVTGETPVVVRQRGAHLTVAGQPGGARAGLPMEVQPSIEILDAGGSRLSGDDSTVVTVTLVATAGGGVLMGATSVAAVGGVAEFADLSVSGASGEYSLVFAASGVLAAVSDPFTLNPGPPAGLVKVSGDAQSAPAATPLPLPLLVAVYDAFGNPMAGVTLQWNVAAGGGELAPSSVVSGSGGLGGTVYTLGRFAGTDSVSVSIPASAVPPAVFSATATPNGTIAGVLGEGSQGVLFSGAIGTGAIGAGARGVGGVGQAEWFSSPGLAQKVRGGLNVRVADPPAVVVGGVLQGASVPGELLVMYRSAAVGAPPAGSAAFGTPGTSSAAAGAIRAAVLQRLGSARVREAVVSPVILTARVKLHAGTDVEAVMAELRQDPRVAVVQRNYLYQSHEVRVRPVDRLVAARWGRRVAGVRWGNALSGVRQGGASPHPSLLAYSGVVPDDPFYGRQSWHYASVGAPDAWELTTGSSSVIVAVIDDGIRFDHPSLAANLTDDGYDFVSGDRFLSLCGGGFITSQLDGDGYDPDPTIPEHYVQHSTIGCYFLPVPRVGGHGLHVAGTIGAVGNDGHTVTGLNWSVKIRPIRVLGADGGTAFDVAQGVLYAAGLPASDGIGGTVPPPAQRAHVINMSLGSAGNDAVLAAAITAAHNAGVLLVASAGNSGNAVSQYPASLPEVISVSAAGPDWERASYSSFGPYVELAAPGGHIAAGDVSFGVYSTRWDFANGAPALDWMNGTSMAAPHVAGIAALLFAREPGITADGVRQRLRQYAVDLGTPGRDDFFGYGLVNARNALTQTYAPPAQRKVKLIDAASGAVVRETSIGFGSAFQFGSLPDGDYWVFAGEDADGDAITGVPFRRFAAFGSAQTPVPVTVNGAGSYPASFQLGIPWEVEPNNSPATAGVLLEGGYVVGTISAGVSSPVPDLDYFRFTATEVGTYVFETVGLRGACGWARDEDTILAIYAGTGQKLLENDDVGFDEERFCSRIAIMLPPGSYYLRVTGFYTGHYGLLARRVE